MIISLVRMIPDDTSTEKTYLLLLLRQTTITRLPPHVVPRRLPKQLLVYIVWDGFEERSQSSLELNMKIFPILLARQLNNPHDMSLKLLE